MFSRREGGGGEFEKDIVKRQIRQLVQAIARLLGASVEVAGDTALDELRRVAGDALRIDPSLLARLDVRSALSLLKSHDFVGRAGRYALVLDAEAELRARAGEHELAAQLRARAIEVRRLAGVPEDFLAE